MPEPFGTSYEGDVATLYKGFMIYGRQLSDPGGMGGGFRAFRNQQYFRDGIASYESTHPHLVQAMIDEVDDQGEFTVEQLEELDRGGVAVDFKELIGKLPFMPEVGPPLPEYVTAALHPSPTLDLMKPPVSEYGRVVADETARLLRDFMGGGNFELKDKFEESGWSSDGIMYNGSLIYTPTGAQYLVEIGVSFAWRTPTEDVERGVTLFIEKPEGPEEAWDGDLSFEGGIAANDALKVGGQS